MMQRKTYKQKKAPPVELPENFARFQVGCVPLQWGSFRQKSPEDWSEERVLREIAYAGYAGISAGPRKGMTPAQTVLFYRDFNLDVAPIYFGGNWWKAEERDAAIERAKYLGDYCAQMGLRELFVSAGGFGDYTSRRNGKTRAQLSGQVEEGDGLTEDEWKILAETLNAIGEATIDSGVRTCYHNHVGAVVETREEMEKLLELTDRDKVWLGPDTGHLLWAGVDVTQFFRDYAPLIKTVHLKDASQSVREKGIEKAWDYGKFSDGGIWRELGEGDIDFKVLVEILRDQDFDGWLLCETDVTKKDTPLESAQINRKYLHEIGI